MSVKEAVRFMQELKLTPQQADIARLIIKEISDRLQFLLNVGLGYLTLDRIAGSLSGWRGTAHPPGYADRISSQRRALCAR